MDLIYTTKDGIPFYRFENLANCQGITHGIYTRIGGVSPPPYASLNVSLGIGDEETNVRQNRDIIFRSLDGARLIFVRQVHGSNVAVLKRDNRGYGNKPGELVTADALVTDQSQILLVIQVADCQSVMLYEPTRRVVANVHSGWRGSVQNIIGRTVETMKQDFDCNPGHIQVGIGPSLGPCCAEFVNYRDEIPRAFWRYKDSDRHFDFWSISRDQLLQAGVSAQNVESSRMCTRCRTDEFFSYRAEKTTGRFAAVIGLI